MHTIHESTRLQCAFPSLVTPTEERRPQPVPTPDPNKISQKKKKKKR